MPSILADIYWAGSLLSEIMMILFTKSAAVLHKYLNDELKLLCLIQFFPEVAQISPSFPSLEKSLISLLEVCVDSAVKPNELKSSLIDYTFSMISGEFSLGLSFVVH